MENSENIKKRNPFVVFLKVLLIILAVLVLLVGGWIGFCFFNKTDSLKHLPDNFFISVHADSVWDAVEPVLDLQAADLFLTNQESAGTRKLLMELRGSDLRNNKWIKLAASREVSGAIYNNDTNGFDFAAVVDFKWLSSVTRLAPVILPHINIKGLEYNPKSLFFEYTNKDSKYFIKTKKNLVIVASNEFLLAQAAKGNTQYSEANRQIMTGKSHIPIRITANSKKLAALALGTEGISAELTKYISSTDLTSLDLSITNENINVKANFPLSKEMLENGDKSLTSLITNKSSVPAFISRLDSAVQYYTLLNAGTLEELKNAVFPLLDSNIDTKALWDKSNSLCKSFLSLTLEELLFSWTGKEFAVFGLENKNDPVFAIQINDENQRQYVFDKLVSSIIIKDNSSLILDGIRLSRLELPKFLQDLLALFKLSLPYPYFAIRDGFIYFSESAENLSAVYMGLKKDGRLTQTENWKAVSSNQSAFNTLSLYYNLERSIPFFLRQNASLSNILELYSLGRFDLRFNDSTLEIQLQAISNSESTTNVVRGFPMELTGRNDGKLYGTEKSIFWVENGKTAIKLDYPSTKMYQKTFNDKIYIVPHKNGSEKLWIVNDLGDVFVLDKDFQMDSDFPIYTGEKPCANPVCAKDNTLIFTTESKNLVFVNTDGSFEKLELPLSGGIKAPVSIEYLGDDEILAMYDKSFLGKILTVKNRALVPEEDLNLMEISFGSPALKALNGDLYKAFITQRGKFYLWKNNELMENFPVKIDGVFNENAVAADDCFYVMSNDCTLTKISLDGQLLSVKFSYTTAENPFIRIIDDIIYACGDGNTLYAFNDQLELLPDFPVAGWGFPVLGDVNGDNIKDLFVLSIDKKLNVYDLK